MAGIKQNFASFRNVGEWFNAHSQTLDEIAVIRNPTQQGTQLLDVGWQRHFCEGLDLIGTRTNTRRRDGAA